MTDTNSINAASDAIEKASDDKGVQGLEALIVAKLTKRTRGIIYDTGKWLGGVAAVAGVVAGVLEGAPALYAAAVAGLLLAASNLIAKANLA